MFRVDVILKAYEATDLGEASSFLGMAITRDRHNHTIQLLQKAYVDDMAKKFNFDPDHHNRRADVPITALDADPGAPLEKEKAGQYASLVGSMLYLANCTRPDISFGVGVLARHLRSPYTTHWKLARQMLKYCIATRDLGLTYGPGSTEAIDLVGYSDSNYGGHFYPVVNEAISRKAVSGYVFLSNGTPVSWSSKKQPVMSRSTDDAEYLGLANAASTGLWLRKLYGEMSGSVKSLTIFGDNMASLQHVSDPGSINRSKHIDIAYQFILDRAMRNDLKFVYVPSAENVADIFTKALTFSVFVYLRQMLGVVQVK